MTSAIAPITVTRSGSATLQIACQIAGAADGVCATHSFLKAASGAYWHNGLVAGGKTLLASGSEIEPVLQFGKEVDTPDSSWQFSPVTHGNQTLTGGPQLFIGNADITGLAVGDSYSGKTASIRQAVSLLYSITGEVAGAYFSDYAFAADGTMTLSTYASLKSGFVTRTWYQGNMPGGSDVNRLTIDGSTTRNITGGGAATSGPHAQTAKLWSTAHSYSITMDLMGTQDYSGDTQCNGMLLIDNVGGPAKVYSVAISSPPHVTRSSFYTQAKLTVASS